MQRRGRLTLTLIAAPVPSAYEELKDWKPAQPNDQNLGGEWWKIFQDPQLDALELQIKVSNQNLKAAEPQYRQARAVLAYNRADYYPTVTAGPAETRTCVSANSPTNSISRGATYNDFVLSIRPVVSKIEQFSHLHGPILSADARNSEAFNEASMPGPPNF